MNRRPLVLGGLVLLAAAGALAAPALGIIPFSELRSGPVFWTIRVPRTILAFLAGAGLSLAGMTFQAMFRNPLVTPFTLGVSSGAAFGATVAIRLGWMFSVLGISCVSLSAFVGALASLMLVYGLAMTRSTYSTSILLLAA